MKKRSILIAACLAGVLLAGCAGSRTEAVSAPAAEAAPAETVPEAAPAETESVEAEPAETGAPVVYFTSDISPESLVKVYDALGWTPTGKTAVKISTGEPPESNYLRPELIGDLVKKVDGRSRIHGYCRF